MGNRYGIELGNAGITVRYKYYAYRWDYSYAVQMHHKFLIIDNAELWTGSYNLSDNAEHNTFENMRVFRGPGFAKLITAYEETFAAMWGTSRDDDSLDALVQSIENDPLIPLVFTPMALDWDEITALKVTIRENCPAVTSEPFRTEPAEHKLCER